MRSILEFSAVRPIALFMRKHERYVSGAAITLGFLWDIFTMGAPDRLYENAILLGYFFIAGGGTLLLSTARRMGISEAFLVGLVQFSFGNLAGGLTVLYGRSGTFEGSALFFILLGGFLIGNEFLKQRYERISFNISVWYLLLLTYLVLVIPVFFGTIGDYIFLVSNIASVVIMSAFLLILRASAYIRTDQLLKKAAISIVGIVLGFNALYFLNIIPPVPLVLKNGGIYHEIAREGDAYRVLYEKPRWYEVLRDTSAVVRIVSGESLYCFSSIRAPAGLSVPVYHRWEFYDEVSRTWVTTLRIAFPIVGGRDKGYRGYSIKSGLREGRFRCSVETERGALIGRMTFQVVSSGTTPLLTEKIL